MTNASFIAFLVFFPLLIFWWVVVFGMVKSMWDSIWDK